MGPNSSLTLFRDFRKSTSVLQELKWSDAKAAKHAAQTRFFFSCLLLRAAYEISHNSILEQLWKTPTSYFLPIFRSRNFISFFLSALCDLLLVLYSLPITTCFEKPHQTTLYPRMSLQEYSCWGLKKKKFRQSSPVLMLNMLSTQPSQKKQVRHR